MQAHHHRCSCRSYRCRTISIRTFNSAHAPILCSHAMFYLSLQITLLAKQLLQVLSAASIDAWHTDPRAGYMAPTSANINCCDSPFSYHCLHSAVVQHLKNIITGFRTNTAQYLARTAHVRPVGEPARCGEGCACTRFCLFVRQSV